MTSASWWCPLAALLLLPLVVTSLDVYVTEGKAASLTCSGPADQATDRFLYWDVVYDHTKTTQLLYKGHKTETTEVLDGGWTLYIPSVTPAFYGTYRCAYNTSSGQLTYHNIQLMRTRTTTFEKYRLPIIVSLVASAAALVILGIICGVYNWRWEKRHGESKGLVRGEEEAATTSNSARHPSFYNEGFTEDKSGDITIISTHV